MKMREEVSNSLPPAVDTAHTTIGGVSGIITWMWCKMVYATDLGSLSYLCPWPCKAPGNSLAQKMHPITIPEQWWLTLVLTGADGTQHLPVPTCSIPICSIKTCSRVFIHLVNDRLVDGSWKGPLFSMADVLLSRLLIWTACSTN